MPMAPEATIRKSVSSPVFTGKEGTMLKFDGTARRFSSKRALRRFVVGRA
jgi:hypothetical protein